MATDEPPDKTWLKETKKKFSRHVQGGRLERFVAAVESNSIFQSIYEALPHRDARHATSHASQDDHDEVDNMDEVDAGPTSTGKAWASPANRPQSSSTPSTSTVTTEPILDPEAAKFLHNAAREGCCAVLEALGLFGNQIENVNVTDRSRVTALHIAAKYGNCEDVEVLLSKRAAVTRDNRGFTPLHEAAASMNPNPKIAELLIGHMTSQNVGLVCATIPEESTTGNTALHFAARNEDISREFIRALKDIDPSIRNEMGDTAFHVAAGAENPRIIVYMLEVFTPAEKQWKMREIESEGKPTLLEICAKRGNAKAMALLIKYGANISDEVLFSLIDKSVNDPTETKKLVDVYRKINDNCVLWDWLTNHADTNEHCPSKVTEPDEYTKKQRNIMLRLLTEPKKVHENSNVIEYAILKGDRVFLNEIVNTPGVFKITKQNKDVAYDITGFLSLSRSCGLIRKAICGKCIAEVEPQNQPQPISSRSYIQLITQNRHLWENTDILHVEPFLTLTQPMCAAVQLFNFAMALIQLLYMIAFSIDFTPPFCSLKYLSLIHI